MCMQDFGNPGEKKKKQQKKPNLQKNLFQKFIFKPVIRKTEWLYH